MSRLHSPPADERDFVLIKMIPLSSLAADPARTLMECVDDGQAIVVELPDHRLVAIHPLDPAEDDDLVSALIEQNASFRALVAKSEGGERRSFGRS